MSRRYFCLMTAALMLLLGVAMTSVDVETAPAVPTPAMSGAPAPARVMAALPPSAPAPQAAPASDYVGSDTCLGCHEDADKVLGKTSSRWACCPPWRSLHTTWCRRG